MKKGMQPPNHKESTVFGEAYKETVADKSATDMDDMMYNTTTLRSGQSKKGEVKKYLVS